MKTRKRILALLLAAGMQAAAAQSEREPEYLLDAPGHVAWDAGGLYEGRLSDGTPFQIELAYPAPQGLPEESATIMNQAYWYPRRFTGETIALVSDKGTAGALALSVRPDPEAPVREQFSIALGDDKLEGKGSWTSAVSGKKLSFSIKRVVLYRAVSFTRPSPEAKAEDDERQFVFSALFPVLKDHGADSWVRERAGRCDASLVCVNKVKVRWYSKGQLSLDAATYVYHYGAAHGNYGSTMRHFAPRNGELVHTRFTAYVAPSASCRQKVSGALVAKLDANRLSWPEQGALDDFHEPNFIPTPAGIEFHWNPYDVGSYAEGMPSVFLTRAELGNCATNLPHAD